MSKFYKFCLFDCLFGFFFLHQYDMVQQKTKTKSYQVLAVAGADLQGSVLPWKIQTYLQ